MKDAGERRHNRTWAAGTGLRWSRWGTFLAPPSGTAARGEPRRPVDLLKGRVGTAALAFRGYDVTNLGRTPELLDHPAYGPVVASVLREASAICAESTHRPIDLVAYVREGGPTSMAHFAEDVALIVAVELAQVRILEELFGVPVRDACLSFGYSIGELAAVVLGGTFRLDQLLPVPLGLAADCAELAADTHLGILFTRAPELPEESVERLCLAASSEGHGMVGPSAILSPNTTLLLGQGDTLDRVERLAGDFLPGKVVLRRNPNCWPPLHTPLVRQRNIPNRAASALYRIAGGTAVPSPKVISCVTGAASYDGPNSREILVRWTDQPQRLWDVIDAALGAGVETVVHVGPSPNLIPSTFARLSNNVGKHLGNQVLQRMGRGVVASMNRHVWLSHLLPSRASLLRAPFLEHIILEDWLLEQPVP